MLDQKMKRVTAEKTGRWTCVVMMFAGLFISTPTRAADGGFEGKFFRGRGDLEYVGLLDISRRMFAPDPEFQNLSMLYHTNWNGLVEGPTWNGWWIQNGYGFSYASLPFLQEPFVTFLQNSQDLWFDQMGDGKRVGAARPYNWVAPDGCLCDVALPGSIIYRQGDCNYGIHDWAMEFTAAGILLQSELLLISRDLEKMQAYLPKLERSANFIETRRDTNNLFLAGPGGNLLAPSYAGWKKPDGTFGKAYLTGLSITYIAALDRLIELEKLARRAGQARLLSQRRQSAKAALWQLTTDEGYFIRSLDPDGVKHGVVGAKRHGYLETSPNHDAVAFRVVGCEQAETIYRKIMSLPELRPHDVILPNYPSYDDTYMDKLEGIWTYGTWVNGGHWSTCEARMILGYYQLGKFEDARRSLLQLMRFARAFRMDNPLTKCGDDVYQPNQPINLTIDAFGPPAAFVRGLFEYLYRADGLTLYPHIPPGITELEQKFPVRFGTKQVFVSVAGAGPITLVEINGKRWNRHDADSVFLPYEKIPPTARLRITLGKTKFHASRETGEKKTAPGDWLAAPAASVGLLQVNAARLSRFCRGLSEVGLANTYEAAHARLALEAMAVIPARADLLTAGKVTRLSDRSQKAADRLYFDTAEKLFAGLDQTIRTYEKSDVREKKRIYACWQNSLTVSGAEKKPASAKR